jgi:uronate dehydrogenase
MKKKILITGGLGRIGKEIISLLEKNFEVTILESPRKKHTQNKNVIYCDISNQEDLNKAFVNMDAIVHLAAISDEDDFIEKIMPTNIAGTYNIFECAKNSSIKKIIFASTFQTIWNYPNNKTITTDMPPRPFNMYACSKIFGENVGRYYSEKYGMSVICLRIGYFLPYGHEWLQDTEKRKCWCSPKDLDQIITKSILNETINYDVFFAISENENSFLDISNMKEKIKYESIDGVKKLEQKIQIADKPNQNMFGKTNDWYNNV